MRRLKLHEEKTETRISPLDTLSYIIIYLLILFSAVLVWMLQYDVPGLDMALLGAAAGGAIFVVARLMPMIPRIVIILGGVAAAEVAAYLMRAELTRGFEYTAQLIYVRFTEVTPGYQAAAMPDIPFEESGMALFLFFAIFLLAAVLGAGILLLRSFWIAIAFSAPFAWFAMGPIVLPPLLPTLCLIGGWVAMLFKIRGRTADAAKLRLAAMGLTMVLVGVLFAVIPIGTYAPSAKTLELRSDIESIDFDRGILNLIESGFGPGRKVAARNTTSVRLTGEGGLQFEEGSAMRIKNEETAYTKQYIRGFSCDTYDGQSWSQSREGYDAEEAGYQPLLYSTLWNSMETTYEYSYNTDIPRALHGVQIELYDSLPYRPMVYGTTELTGENANLFHFEEDAYLVGRGDDSREYSMKQIEHTDGYVEALGSVDSGSVELFGAYTFDVSAIPEEERDRWTILEMDGALGGGGDLAMEYGYRQLTDEELMTPEEAEYLDYIDTQYTQLPEGVADSLRGIAAENNIPMPESREDWLRTFQAVKKYIGNVAEYSRNPGAQPRNEDFVEYFLTQSQKGYCVHFASAGTAMLRALGVPARYAEGFLMPPEGEVQYGVDEYGSEYSTVVDGGPSKWRQVPNANAHAWVEVWYPHLGWLPLDVTPGGPDYTQPEEPKEEQQQNVPGDASDSAASSSSQAAEDDSHSEDADDASSSEAQADSEARASESGGSLPPGARNVLIVGVCVLVAAAALLLGYRVHATRRMGRFRQKDTNAAALEIYAYLERLGRFGYKPSGQATDLAGKAKFSPHILGFEEREQMLREALAARVQTLEELTFPKKLLFYIWGL